MGGSGGGGSIFGSVRENASCSEFTFRTQLHSPNPSIVSLITVGTELELVLESQVGPCNAMFHSSIAGTILYYELLTLIDCMNKGFKYIAIVKSITGGNCSVIVQAKK